MGPLLLTKKCAYSDTKLQGFFSSRPARHQQKRRTSSLFAKLSPITYTNIYSRVMIYNSWKSLLHSFQTEPKLETFFAVFLLEH